MTKQTRGYKVFNPDFTCMSFQYKVGETYHIPAKELKPCEKGFHFCKQLIDCFHYYLFDSKNKVAEVVATGEVIEHEDKLVAHTIKIIRELSWDEVLELINRGQDNTGLGNMGDANSGNYNIGNENAGDCNIGHENSGDYNIGYKNSGNYNTGGCNSGNRNTGGYNIGDYNTGGCNSGNRNTGDYNTGGCNTGDFNTGNRNTGRDNTGHYNVGHHNTGNCNTGNYNTGSYNAGHFNACDYSNGMFNTRPPKVYMFNKPTEYTYEELQKKFSEALNLLSQLGANATLRVGAQDMTDKEKAQHPEYRTTGGYTKRLNFKDTCKANWKELEKEDKELIKSLPNFDKEIFKELTGITVE